MCIYLIVLDSYVYHNIYFYTVDISGISKLQVMALRDMPLEAKMLKTKLFPTNVLGSCDDSCTTNSDCGGFTLCQWCWEKTNPFDGSTYRSCTVLP